MATPRLSVVAATYNRAALAQRLVRQLARQTLPSTEYELVIVDDGSKVPARPLLEAEKVPYRLRILEQENAGAAAARHRGVLAAEGDVIVITDDDMQVREDFLERHLRHHAPGTRRVVLGRILPDPALASMPLFERWYAYLLDKHVAALRHRTTPIPGTALFTGNVSLRREDYVRAGGFDLSLKHSEDAELGVRLERLGVEFVLDEEAVTLHGSDHTSYASWLARARRYGVFDLRIAHKHPDLPHASPYRFLFEVNPLARPLLLAALMAPELTAPLSSATMKVTWALDRAGLQRLAFAGTSVVYSMEYYRGLRDEAKGLVPALEGLWAHARQKLQGRSSRTLME